MLSKFIYRLAIRQVIYRAFSVGVGEPPKPEENPVRFKFHLARDDITHEVLAREGESLLEVAHNNHVELEGACA